MAALAPTALGASARVCPTASPGCAFTSIQAAIAAAHSGDTITIAPGTYHENLTVGSTAATRLSLVGPGATVDGGGNGSVLTVAAGHTVSVVGLTLTNGSAPSGGGVNSAGSVSLTNVLVTGNHATGDLFSDGTGLGGGIFNDAGTLTLNNTQVTGNTAQRGAGIATGSPTAEGTATLNNSRVSNNTASAAAGGVLDCGTLTANNTTISNNTASQGGGLTNCGPIASGVFGTVTLNNSPVTGNHALGGMTDGVPLPGHGGGISNAGRITLRNSPVTDNTAPAGQGGGIFNQGGTVTLQNSAVVRNTPPQCVGVPAPGCGS
jgi:hypothetical protein